MLGFPFASRSKRDFTPHLMLLAASLIAYNETVCADQT